MKLMPKEAVYRGEALKSISKIPEFDATDFIGIPVTLFDSAVPFGDDPEHPDMVSFPELDCLLASVAVSRASHHFQMHGSELRFLRLTLGLTQSEFAIVAGLTGKKAFITVSKWERGKVTPTEYHERQVRIFTVETLAQFAPGIPVKDIAGMEITPIAALHPDSQDRPIRTGMRLDPDKGHYVELWHA